MIRRRSRLCSHAIDARARRPGMPRRCVLALLVSGAALGWISAPARGETLVLTGATLIDGTGRDPVPSSVVVIEQGRIRIAGAAADCTIPDGARIVDLTGHWISPGLVDAHVHLDLGSESSALEAQTRRFALGITTTREASSLTVTRALREKRRASDADVPRPRLVVAARPVQKNFDEFTHGSADTATLVAALKALGVDAIKLKGVNDAESAVEAVNAARLHGLPVYGHTWAGATPVVFHREAVQAGLNGVSHMAAMRLMGVPDPAVFSGGPPAAFGTDAFWEWHKNIWLETSPELLEAAVREMIARDVWLEPLLTQEYYFGTRLFSPEQFAYLNPNRSLRQQMAGPAVAPPGPRFGESYARIRFVIQRFYELGGMLVVGGDDKLPGWDVAKEIELLRDAGLPAMDALQCATRNAAVAIGRADTLGTLRPGLLADIVVYGSDPLGAIENMGDVIWVIKGGVMHDPASVLRPLCDRHDREARRLWLVRGAKLLALIVGVGFVLGLAWRARRHLLASTANSPR